MSIEVIREQFQAVPIVASAADCTGKTFVVTGANTGLGFECAQHLVRLGSAHVILAVRTLSKGEDAKGRIEAATGKKGIAEVWKLDLCSHESVREFAARVNGLERVDAVIENASVALGSGKQLAEALEMTLTVNVVSTFLLAALVLPKLSETAKRYGGGNAHLVIVGSGLAFDREAKKEVMAVGKEEDVLDGVSDRKPGLMARYDIPLSLPSPVTIMTDADDDSYPTSKLMQLFAARQLAALNPVDKTGVVINYVNPGLCRTDLTRNVSWPVWFAVEMMRLVMARSAEKGSRTLIHAAFAGKESHGKYVGSCAVKE